MPKIEKKDFLHDFIIMTKASWTYNKMTEDEKSRCIDLLTSERVKMCLLYNDKHKWRILNAVYNAYLLGLGYDGFEWRDK